MDSPEGLADRTEEAKEEFRRFQNNFIVAVNKLEEAKLSHARAVSLAPEEYNAILLGLSLLGDGGPRRPQGL